MTFPLPMPASSPMALLAAFILLLSACSSSPGPLIRYRTADAPGDVWERGQKHTPARTRDLDFTSTFLDSPPHPKLVYPEPGPLFFQLSVTNISRDTCLLDPADFRIRCRGTDSAIAIMDPEWNIDRLRRDRQSENADYASSEAISPVVEVTLGMLAHDIVSALASEAPDKERRDAAVLDAVKKSEEHRAEAKESHRIYQEEAADHAAFWSDQALRKTTLPPGRRISGPIGFRLDPNTAPPDTLLLQYREATGAYADLGRYGLVPDSVFINRKAAYRAADSAQRRATALRMSY
jgi:hypothetical protein